MKIALLGKSLSLPSFGNNGPVSGRPMLFGNNASLNPGQDTVGKKVTADSLFTIHNNSGDVAGCVKEIQNWTCKGGVRFVDPENTDEVITGNLQKELHTFFNSPHSTTPTFKKLKDKLIFDREISGNAYAHIIRNVLGTKVLGLQVMDPRTVSIVADKYGTIHRYIQRTAYGEAVIFHPAEVLHWKRGEHSNNPLFGFSAMEPIIWEVQTDLSAMVGNFKFFENNAIPAAIYIMDETLSDTEMDKAVDFIKNNHSGAENRHKASALMGVKEIKQMQLSNKDVEFLEGRKFSRQKVCGAFGVPEFLLGITDAVNNNNGQELFRKFIEGTIEDQEEDFASFINDQLFTRIGLEGLAKFQPLPQQVETQEKIIEMALKEYESGAITLRQYKTKTGQEVTEVDEQNPMIDQYIIHKGAGALLLEDVGSQDLEKAKNAEAIAALANQN